MESQSGNLGLEISLIIPLTLRKYTQKSNRPNIYPLFFHTSRERLFAFFPSRGLYPSEVREKTYTSLTTPGLYFISSRKCEIAQSAIYQKISRHLKLFLNITFVKSLPKQFSLHFFCSPPTFFLVAPREKHHFVASHSPKPTICRLRHRTYFLLPRRFDTPAAPIGQPPRLASRFGTSFTRWARNCASLLTAHRTLPRRARKMGSLEGKIGEPRRKNWGLRPKTGVFRAKHPRFYPPACTHAAQARTKKGLHPNSFVQSFVF